VYHWGDIDPGGIKIAYWIEQALIREGRRLRLHMMTAALAKKYGSPAKPAVVLRDRAESSYSVAELVRFMSSEDAHTLEQEELDPVAPNIDSREL
jgi:hypothetical protein